MDSTAGQLEFIGKNCGVHIRSNTTVQGLQRLAPKKRAMRELRQGNSEGKAGVTCGSFGERKLQTASYKNEKAGRVERVEKSLAFGFRCGIGANNGFSGAEKKIRLVEMSFTLKQPEQEGQRELVGRKLVQLRCYQRPALLPGNRLGDGALAATFGALQEDHSALTGMRAGYFLQVFEEWGGQMKIVEGTRRVANRDKRAQTFVWAALFQQEVDYALLRVEKPREKGGFAFGRFSAETN